MADWWVPTGELGVGWGCLCGAPDTDTDIHLLSDGGSQTLSAPRRANYLSARLQQMATKLKPRKKKEKKQNTSTKTEILLRSDRKPYQAWWVAAEHEHELEAAAVEMKNTQTPQHTL